MESLRAGETTLAKVGDSHGLTRERIRQIYKLYWGEKYTVTVTTRAERREKEKEEEKREYGLFENRVNRAKKNCSTYTGIVAENLFKDKCESLGYDVKMMNGHYLYDAEVNGIPVDVKSRTESAIYVKCKSNQKYYHFRTTDKQRAAVKFYPFLLFDEGSWYIIPVEILGKGRTFFVPKYDITYSGKNRYKELQKYREAWHLLAGSLDTT
uniref:Putative sigma-70 region domain containing protein n=1 Tax=viral metagenome TaxID=1070528 RepID=A0A6H1Z5S5_9ZZZZ